MVRWLAAVVLGVSLIGSSAHAQVFKPRTKPAKTEKKTSKSADKSDKADKSDSDAPATKKTAKKQSRSSAKTSRKVTTKPKKSIAAERSRPDDLTPDPAPRGGDPDFVKITDDADDE